MLLLSLWIEAQCAGGISAFPYIEDFETSAAWTSGGPPCVPLGLVINDWAWCRPQKNVINSAGSGQRCWMVGDSVGWFYAYGERSWVQSPCFNFSAVQHPYIQLKVWWETEWKYDGALLQYSLDNGSTWSNIGSYSDATDCMNANWYNYDNVTNVGVYSHSLPGHSSGAERYAALTNVNEAWCGNIQTPDYTDTTGVSGSTCQTGHGSGHWVTAKHCMPYLAGHAGVLLRMAFGAGTSCNNFNGFAFDSVAIGEAPPNTADFTYTCVNTTTLSFRGSTTLCPDTFQWNFGDPASGAANTINGAGTLTPTHSFSGPGTYTVTFTAKGGPCNAAGTMSKTVHILGVTAAPQYICGSTTASVIAVVNAATNSAPYGYSWSTSPAQHGDTAAGLAPGTYTVTVTSAGACSATTSGTVTASAPLIHSTSKTPATCTGNDGTASVAESGGATPYQYAWSGNSSTTSSITNVQAGTYIVTVTDARGCSDTAVINVPNNGGIIASVTGVSDATCADKTDGSISITISGGSAPYTYHWGLATNSNNSQMGFGAGTYTITVSDNNGCNTTVSATVAAPPPLIATISSTPVSCHGHTDGAASTVVSGGTPGYTYQWSTGGSGATISGLARGQYIVTVTDQHTCTVSDTAQVTEPAALSVSATAQQQSCGSIVDGSVSLQASGGTPGYSYQWTPLSSSSSTLSGLSAGTYFYTVTDSHSCTDTGSSVVTIAATVLSNPTISEPLCQTFSDGSITLHPSGGTPDYTYAWSNGALANINSSLAAGYYYLTITDARGCSSVDTFRLSYQKDVTVEAGPDQTIELGTSAQLNAVLTGDASSYIWTPDYNLTCTTCLAPQATPLQTTSYIISVSDTDGCKASDTLTIFLHKPYHLYVPNAFTPNSDGTNDYFEVYGNKASWKYLDVKIFNRWGEKVFDSNDLDFRWNGYYKGALQEPNVYVYVLNVTFIDGYSTGVAKGSLTLIR
ncbi:MAG: gliding motility-associated C-terminal domain-containing protein [Bacteroidetes bacterium]|nr:gliding motility-associated C-terminal domain-containing protein [Bacteroidota bacterium]